MKLNPLTESEKAIIVNKGTEGAFSGEYYQHIEDGIYICRQCNLPLFDAQAKFDADCGWPAYDDTFDLAVKETVDVDGNRKEITCARCGAHLGHVFRGEEFTKKNTRHCVNSISIKFIMREKAAEYLLVENQLKPEYIVLAGGCFWCIEAAMLRVSGVLNCVSGYAGGQGTNPTYQEVSTGKSGFIEAVKVIYDSNTLSVKDLLLMFFRIHDPTSKDQQGNDIGSQYRSAIFVDTQKQRELIVEIIKEFQPKYNKPIVTEVRVDEKFYRAEEYHQRYFEKNPSNGYCQLVIQPKIAKISA